MTGKAYALSLDKILVKEFTYDGAGPDAFFYAGTEGEPGEEGDLVIAFPTSKDRVYEYGDEDVPVLGSFDGSKDITLQLNKGITVNDLR